MSGDLSAAPASFERHKPADCPLTEAEWRAAVAAGQAEVRERREALERAARERQEEVARAQLQLQHDIEARAAAASG